MKKINNRPFLIRGKTTTISTALFAALCIAAASTVYTLHETQRHINKLSALSEEVSDLQYITTQITESYRSRNAYIMAINENIENLKYIENKSVADSLHQVYINELYQLEAQTAERLHNLHQAMHSIHKER